MSQPSETASHGLMTRIHGIFNNRRARKILVRIRVPIGIALFAGLVYIAKRDWFLPALGISLFGEFIQLWCFASLDKKGTLAFNGLYKHVRNPMYLGRFFIVLGYLLLLEIWAVIPILFVLYWFYMYNRVRREEKALRKIFGEPYDQYCASVNRFLPSLRGAEGGTLLFWKWKLFLKNNGILNLLAVVITYAMIYLWLFKPFQTEVI
jgi:hypothetical protein